MFMKESIAKQIHEREIDNNKPVGLSKDNNELTKKDSYRWKYSRDRKEIELNNLDRDTIFINLGQYNK